MDVAGCGASTARRVRGLRCCADCAGALRILGRAAPVGGGAARWAAADHILRCARTGRKSACVCPTRLCHAHCGIGQAVSGARLGARLGGSGTRRSKTVWQLVLFLHLASRPVHEGLASPTEPYAPLQKDVPDSTAPRQLSADIRAVLSALARHRPPCTQTHTHRFLALRAQHTALAYASVWGGTT